MAKNLDVVSYSQKEEVIKTYQYHSTSSSDKALGQSVKNLIVTTKRIILESRNTAGFSRDEFQIDFIESINTRFYRSKKSKIWLSFMLLGIFIIVLGIVLVDFFNSLFSGFNIILYGIGALFFIFGLVYLIIKKPKQSFSLTLYSSKQLYEFSNISAENYIIKERKKGSKKIKVFSKITPAALMMLNELSALLLDIKEFKYQVNLEKMLLVEKEIIEEEYAEKYQNLLNNLKEYYK